MRYKLVNWSLFLLLCFIWGSSFMLMKIGLGDISPYQVASIRLLSAGIVLSPFAWKALRQIPRNKIFLAILTGMLGSFFPAYLFTIAQTRIDSSLAGILNALTPLFTVVIGVLFFQLRAARKEWTGIIIGFIGLALLPFAAYKGVSFRDFSYSSLVLLATAFYGLNVNIISRHMKSVNSLNIAALAFVFLIIPSTIILTYTGYFELGLTGETVIRATIASAVLGIFGTAVASILFYMLLKRAGALFASTVTYGIPFVAIFWGLLDNEPITFLQVGCLGIILIGVYLANK